MSTHVNVAVLKSRLSEYLDLAEKGDEVIVCRRNVPVVRFEGIASKARQVNRSRRGSKKGTVTILGDLTAPLIPAGDWETLR